MQANPVLLALLLAHLVGDFVLPRRRELAARPAARLAASAGHGALHLALTAALLGLATRVPLTAPRTWAVLALLSAAHLGIEALRAAGSHRDRAGGGLALFLAEQVLQLLVVVAAATVLAGTPELLAPAEAPAGVWGRLLLVAVVYLAVTVAGGDLIGHALAPFATRLKVLDAGEEEQLADAGRYIGWLERFLVVTALAADSPIAASIVVAVKSLFRFPEITGRPWAEYFVIGTLLSTALAVVGAVVLRALW